MRAVPSPEVLCDLRLIDILENNFKKYGHNAKIVAHFRNRDVDFMPVNTTESESEKVLANLS